MVEVHETENFGPYACLQRGLNGGRAGGKEERSILRCVIRPLREGKNPRTRLYSNTAGIVSYWQSGAGGSSVTRRAKVNEAVPSFPGLSLSGHSIVLTP